MRTNKKQLWKPIARLLITGLSLFLILHVVDVPEVLSLFARAHLLYAGLAIGMMFLIRVLMSWKWKLLFYYAEVNLPLGYLLKVILISGALGIFLPSSVGVDIIRTATVGRRTGYTAAAVSTIADRVMGIVAMALWSLTAALVALWLVPSLQHVLWPIIGLCVSVMAIISALLSDTAIRLVQRTLGRSGAESTREQSDTFNLGRLMRLTMDKAIFIHQELRGLLVKPPVFITIFFINILFQGGRIMLFYLLFLATGTHIAFLYHIIFAPIIMFITLLPFSFLGIGIKEVAFVFFYTQVGVDPASALAVSVWTYIVAIPLLVLGGLLYLLDSYSDLTENKEP